MVDAARNQIDIKGYLQNAQAAALRDRSMSRRSAFAIIRNVPGRTNKYPFDPFYGGFSPHVSLAWSPNFSDGVMGAIFGQNKTVIRGGYARIYGRLNGVDLLLVPLLGPGLLQAVSCPVPTIQGACSLSTAGRGESGFRIGADGMTAPLPTVTQTLPQPFIPGATQNGVLNTAAADGSQLDPNMRPNHSDEFNFTIQRSFSSKMVMEVGYIGRKISNEFQEINIDAVPYMTTLGGQSFAQAFAAVYQQLCGGLNTSARRTRRRLPSSRSLKPCWADPNSPFCSGSASCTAAVVKSEVANFQNGESLQRVDTIWPRRAAGRLAALFWHNPIRPRSRDSSSAVRSTLSTRTATATTTPRSCPSRPRIGMA